jgi:hypothetical protein
MRAVVAFLLLVTSVGAGPSATATADPASFEFALIEEGTAFGSLFSSTDTWSELAPLLEDEDREAVFWFRLDGRAWTVYDAATISAAHTILGPVRAAKLEFKAAKKKAKKSGNPLPVDPALEERWNAASRQATGDLIALARRAVAAGRARPFGVR